MCDTPTDDGQNRYVILSLFCNISCPLLSSLHWQNQVSSLRCLCYLLSTSEAWERKQLNLGRWELKSWSRLTPSPGSKKTMKMSASSLPRLGLGMAALGRPGYINLERSSIFGTDSRTLEKMQTQANLVLDCLFDSMEMPWIDCARSYGLSEKFTGEYLKSNNISPDKVYVSSKWGYSKF